METFWFFLLRFCHAYDSAYDSDLWFSLLVGHKRSYDSAYDSNSDSFASENQPLQHNSDQKTARLASKRIFPQNLQGELVNFETNIIYY